MEVLSRQLYACVSSAVEQFITKASTELDVDREKLMNIWNSSADSELSIKSVSPVLSVATSAAPKRTKPDPNAKQCVHLGTRGKTKGEQCTSKACPESAKGYCKKHMKGESATTSPKGEKSEKVIATTSRSVSSNKTLATPAVNTIKVESLPIKVNKFGNYQNTDGLVFDRSTHEAYGRQSPDGKVIPLSADDIRECKQYGYKYRIPEQLKSKEDEGEEEVEEVEEVEEEEVEDVEEEEN